MDNAELINNLFIFGMKESTFQEKLMIEASNTIKALIEENERLRDIGHLKELYEEAEQKAEKEAARCRERMEHYEILFELAVTQLEYSERQRAAAVGELEKIMLSIIEHDIKPCAICLTADCRNSGGQGPCKPQWRGRNSLD